MSERNELSLGTKEKMEQQLASAVLKRSGTNEKQLELKRRELGGLNIALESMVVQMQQEGEKLPPDELSRLSNTASLTGMLALSKGMELLVDCVTSRSKVRVKNRKTGKIEDGFVRFGVGDIAEKIALMLGSDEGLVVTNEMMADILNDIGVRFKAFRDEKGVLDPNKYLQPEEAHTQKEVEEEEAATTEEQTAAEERGKRFKKK
jgi:hypothetical protein